MTDLLHPIPEDFATGDPNIELMAIEYFRQNYDKWFSTKNPMSTLMDLTGYFRAPASSKHHGAFPTGLFCHSLKVAEYLASWNLNWENERSPYVVGLLHDLCKVDNYIPKEVTTTKPVYFKSEIEAVYTCECETHIEYDWNKTPDISGHGFKSIALASRFITLTEEEVMCIIYHMGPFQNYGYSIEEYSRICDKWPNVMWTHHADMLATHVDKI